MTSELIDLRSDTLTLPTPEMRESMLTAPLGDDSRDGDPTVLELEAYTAELLGKEAALLTPSGTMSNLIALRTHTQPGAAAVVEQNAHLFLTEFGGIAGQCGLVVLPVPGRLGAMNLEALAYAARRALKAYPERGLVCLENTHNAAGGTALSLEYTQQCSEIAHRAGLPVHLDGARLFNAAVALGVEARRLVEPVDSVCICLSKGLSAPVGSVLAGNRAFIERARLIRRAFGGAMRQAGILAAPGLVALHTMIPRLAEDHAHARWLGERLAGLPGLGIDLETVQTNMVKVDVSGLGVDAGTFAAHLAERGVRGLPDIGVIVRFVTYRGIEREHMGRAAQAVAGLVQARPWTV